MRALEGQVGALRRLWLGLAGWYEHCRGNRQNLLTFVARAWALRPGGRLQSGLSAPPLGSPNIQVEEVRRS